MSTYADDVPSGPERASGTEWGPVFRSKRMGFRALDQGGLTQSNFANGRKQVDVGRNRRKGNGRKRMGQ